MFVFLRIKETKNTLIVDKKIDIQGGLYQNNFFIPQKKENESLFELDNLYKNYDLINDVSYQETKIKVSKIKFEESANQEEALKKKYQAMVKILLDKNINVEEHINFHNYVEHEINKKRNINYYKQLSKNNILKLIRENISSVTFSDYIGKNFYIEKKLLSELIENSEDFFFVLKTMYAYNDIGMKNIEHLLFSYINNFWPSYTQLIEEAIDNKVHNKIKYWLQKRSISEKQAFYFLYKKPLIYWASMYIYKDFMSKYWKDDIKTKFIFNLFNSVFSTTEGKKYKAEFIKNEISLKKVIPLLFQEWGITSNNFILLMIIGIF